MTKVNEVDGEKEIPTCKTCGTTGYETANCQTCMNAAQEAEQRLGYVPF